MRNIPLMCVLAFGLTACSGPRHQMASSQPPWIEQQTFNSTECRDGCGDFDMDFGAAETAAAVVGVAVVGLVAWAVWPD